MLKPSALAAALGKVNTGGVQSVLLFNLEGVLLAFTGSNGDDERSKAAISANIWNIYQRRLDSNETVSARRLEFLKLLCYVKLQSVYFFNMVAMMESYGHHSYRFYAQPSELLPLLTKFHLKDYWNPTSL